MKKRVFFIFLIVILTIGYAQTPVAVIDFNANSLSKGEVKALTDRLRNELFNYKQFDLMERAYMEEILDEQGFQLSGCTSDECVVEAGKLIGVEQMIGGSVSQVGKTYTVAARIISIETGKIVKTASYDFTGEIDNLLKQGMKHIAAQLAGIDPDKIEYGNVSVLSNVPKTKIFLQKSFIGSSPLKKRQLETGSYSFAFQKKYFNPVDTIISISAKENKLLKINMIPQREKIQLALKKCIRQRKIYAIGSVVAFGAAGYFKYSSDKHYDEYKKAGKNATSLHDKIDREDMLTQVSLGIGGALLIPVIKYSLDIGKLNRYLSIGTDPKNDSVKLSFEVKL